MSEQIEIEFKNLLSDAEFERLIAAHHISDEQFIEQKNHYFDTPNFALKDCQSALRIREKNGRYEMTLKQPLPDGHGLLETNLTLDSGAARALLSGETIQEGPVYDKVQLMGIDPNLLSCFGTLTTARAEIPYEDGLLVFDKSTYFDVTDYELEFEANHYEKGKIIFQELLQKANIPARATDNKVKRFFMEMQRVKKLEE